MKKNKILTILSCFILLMIGCTDLDEEQFSVLNEDEYPNLNLPNADLAFITPAVVQLRKFVSNQQYWLMLEGGTDECIIPTRGSGWGDGGQWEQLHKHTWNAMHPKFNDMWIFAYEGVAICNLNLFNIETAPESEAKNNVVAQLKAMRAFYYFLLMDSFGNVPLVTSFLDTETPTNSSRTEIYNFLVSELTEVSESITDEVDPATYGFPTKWFAHFLLAKLYLNAEVYTGVAANFETITQLDIIIDSGKFALADNYMSMFSPTNGPGVSESIFALPNDASAGSTMNFPLRFLPGRAAQAFGVDAGGWGGHATLPEFYAKFTDPTDQRNEQWLAGLVSKPNGDPVLFDDAQMNLINELRWGEFDATNEFNVGGDNYLGNGEIQGVRSVKYQPDPNQVGGQGLQNNDYIFFRYADVVLMKAEALFRLGNNSEALGLINEVRTKRNASPRTTINLDAILEERGFEFAFEHWRRNDMIRFGTWEDSFGLKTNADINKRLFPIPQLILDVNPNLQQNPGY